MAKAKKRKRAPKAVHPDQPLVHDKHRRLRFKANKIVQHLLDHGGIDLNQIAMLPFSREDRVQFAQLIGYSLDGWGTLSYVSDHYWNRVNASAEG